jgi:diguanylate cyclase (GGDEF)-like protein
VLRNVTLAVVAALLALAAIGLTAVRATRSATEGADRIESEFAERVRTDAALLAATENLDLAELRLRSVNPREAMRLERRIADSDAQLARTIGVALEPGKVRPAEGAVVERVDRAYGAYIRRRAPLMRRDPPADPRTGAAMAERLRRSFTPLRAALTEYAGIHFAEADRNLRELREAGRARNWLLLAVLAFGVASLAAIVFVTRGIVARVRGYGIFARDVASGDLDVRLRPEGRDELTALAHSLNGMVEQLSGADRRRRDTEREEAAYRAGQDAFSEVLQVTESEREAHDLLKRHIERTVRGSRVVVLNRNHSQDRLEAATALPGDSPLREPLSVAQPRSCLAVRLARTHDSGHAGPAMLECAICGSTAEESTCIPLLVSGEVIGSVLIDHPGPLAPTDERRVHESVAQAAPVLSNLRTLALAEYRAATDALTGLPNRRAVQDALKRMTAQSARRRTPLAAIMLDLDHFKQINDTLGHDHGDTVLAAVGVALASTVRASDFVGRTGGEEFLVLLPDTEATAAVEVAEKLRAAVASLSLTGVERPITASFGVAVHPEVATEPEALLRAADRALYNAKANGRNRVELGVPSDGHDDGDGADVADVAGDGLPATGRRFSPGRGAPARGRQDD